MKTFKSLRVVALAGFIMFLGQVAHASLLGGIGDVVTSGSYVAATGDTSSTDCYASGSIGGVSGALGAINCNTAAAIDIIQNSQIEETCVLANGASFTINFGTDEAAAEEFVAMCETAQLQLLWYDNLVRWTAASCEN